MLIDGAPVNACLVPFAQAQGTRVVTIEGLKKRKLQQAFISEGGAQCGFCTPGMLMAAAALEAGASLDEQRRGLSGNL
ncbi:2Fe-2S iron-sulfur cluster-binding protein, partial [Enterococcus casseliflavus]|uniref:2Fe-2S iron-sulfur cluster-binding protein n=1 Tax=Enterococcus casseliflavus TaxID=37734 RepID=UPI003D0E810F